MAKQLYSEFADLPALEAEQARVLAIFAKIKEEIKTLNDLGLQINSSSTTDGLGKARKASEEAGSAISKQQKEILKLTIAIEEQKTKEAALIAELKQELASQKALNVEQSKTSKLRSQEFEALTKLQVANKDLNRSQQLRAQYQRLEADSGKAMYVQFQRVERIVTQLSKAQRETARGQALIEYGKKLRAGFAGVNQELGVFRDNVGNYANSLADGFELVRKEVERLQVRQKELNEQRTTVGGFQTEAMKKEYDSNASALATLDNAQKKASASGATLDKQAKIMAQTFKTLSSNESVSREFIQGFKVAAAEAKDTVGDLNDEIKALSSDTRKLDLVVSAIGSIASAAELGVSGYALLGGESEDAQRALSKLVAIQGVANSVRQLGTDITTKGTAANKLFNAIQEQGAILFDKNATAAKKFGVVLKGLGILAVISGLVLLFKYLSGTEDAAKKAEKAMSDLNDQLDRNAKANARTDSQRNFATQNLINQTNKAFILEENRLKVALAAAKTDKERERIQGQINDLRKKNKTDLALIDVDAKTAELQRTETRLQEAGAELKKLEDERDALIRKKNADDNVKKSSPTSFGTILDRFGGNSDEEEIKGLDERIKVRQQKLEEFTDLYQTQSQDLVVFIGQTNNDLLTSDEDTSDKRVKATEDMAKKIRDAEYRLFIQRRNFAIEAQEALLNEDSDVGANFQIEASNKVAINKAAIANRTRVYELKQEGLTAADRVRINEEADHEILKIKQENVDRILRIQLNALSRQNAAAISSADEFDARERERAEKRAQEAADRLSKSDSKGQAERDERLQSLNAAYVAELKAADGNAKKIEAANQYYAQKKEKIELDYQRSVIESQIRFYEYQLTLLETGSVEQLDAMAKLANAKLQLSNMAIAGDTSEIESKKQLKQAYADLFFTISETGFEIFNNIFDQQKERINSAITDVQRLADAEKARVDASTDDEQKKAAKIALINDRAQRQREELERKQRAIDRQRAVVERANQVFQLGIQTFRSVATIQANAAVAASNPLLTPPQRIIQAAQINAQIPFVLATSGIALAGILSQPLPGYFKGRNGGPEEYAQLAEKGREISYKPGSGKARVWDRPAIGKLAAGEVVLTNQVTEQILASVSTPLSEAPVKPTVIVAPGRDIKDDEIIDALERLIGKSSITIVNEHAIESTPFYNQHFKR